MILTLSQVRVLGLGKSKSVNDSLQSTQCDTMRGTYLFMPPEVILYNQETSTATDIWAFACTIIELYSEKSVWDASNFMNGWMCAKENLDNKYVPKMNLVPSYIRAVLYKCFIVRSSEKGKHNRIIRFI